jgi:hypothetical protein
VSDGSADPEAAGDPDAPDEPPGAEGSLDGEGRGVLVASAEGAADAAGAAAEAGGGGMVGPNVQPTPVVELEHAATSATRAPRKAVAIRVRGARDVARRGVR